MDFFQKEGGGSEAIQKFWDTFCAPTILEFWAEKGGGLTKSKSFWTLFTLILVKYDTKSAPKVPGKKSAYKKVSQKFQKSGGGVRPFWKKSIIKLHFFCWEAPLAGTVWFELPACYHQNLSIFWGVWLFQTFFSHKMYPTPVKSIFENTMRNPFFSFEILTETLQKLNLE